jgi:hypothetical protein
MSIHTTRDMTRGSVDLFGFIADYIYSVESLVEFQRMSIESYIATMYVVSEYTHFIIKKDVSLYLRSPNMLLKSSELPILTSVENTEIILYMIPNDISIYYMPIYRTVASGEHTIMFFPKIIIFQHPSCPIFNLSFYFVMTTETMMPRSSLPTISKKLHIKELKINYLPECETVDANFCQNIELEKIDLSGLLRVKTIERAFMARVECLTNLDMSVLKSLERVKKFALNNSEITNLKIRNLQRLEEISEYFGQESQIKTIVLDNCTKVSKIGHSFFGKASVEKIKIDRMPGLLRIDGKFMIKSPKIKSFTLSGMPNLQYIGDWFFGSCDSLETVDLSSIPGKSSLRTIEYDFLGHCSKLKKVNLSGNTLLETIGHNFLERCSSVEDIYLEKLPSTKFIGKLYPPSKSIRRIYVDDPSDYSNLIVIACMSYGTLLKSSDPETPGKS